MAKVLVEESLSWWRFATNLHKRYICFRSAAGRVCQRLRLIGDKTAQPKGDDFREFALAGAAL
jgi:hypothetical protein